MNLFNLYKTKCPACKKNEIDCFIGYDHPKTIKCKCRSCGHKWGLNQPLDSNTKKSNKH